MKLIDGDSDSDSDGDADADGDEDSVGSAGVGVGVGWRDGFSVVGADDELGSAKASESGDPVSAALGVKTVGRSVGVMSVTAIEGSELGTGTSTRLGPVVGRNVGSAVGSPANSVTMTLPSPPFTCPNFLLRDPIPTPCV